LFWYELLNGTSDKVPIVFWDLIDEGSAFDLPGHDRLRAQKRRLSKHTQGFEGPTKIGAFRDKTVESIALQTFEEVAKKLAQGKATSQENPFLKFERSAVLDPAAANAIQLRQIPDVEVAVIDGSGDAVDVPPPVSDMLAAPFGEIHSTSSVYSGGPGTYGVYSSIEMKPRSDVKIEVFAPALLALQKLRGGGTTAAYLDLLKGSREPISSLPAKVFTVSALAIEKPERVFVVEHPVTVKWIGPSGQGSTCLKAALYSPFPVSIGSDYCVR